jgi:hypothetical protein
MLEGGHAMPASTAEGGEGKQVPEVFFGEGDQVCHLQEFVPPEPDHSCAIGLNVAQTEL